MNRLALRYLLLAASHAAVALPSVAFADRIVAGNLPPVRGYTPAWEEVGYRRPLFENLSKGQPFVPRFSGLLTEVEALIVRGNTRQDLPPLTVAIHTSIDGIPVSRLAAVEFPASEFLLFLQTKDARKTVDFRSFRISLKAGDQYMVTFETPFGVDYPPAYLVGYPYQSFDRLGLSSSYARDSVWRSFNDGREMGIEVRAVPEPPSFAIAASCLAGLAAVRRQRRGH